PRWARRPRDDRQRTEGRGQRSAGGGPRADGDRTLPRCGPGGIGGRAVNPVTLTGGTVVSSLDPVELLAGNVAVEDGRVASIGAAPPGTATRDCSACLVISGNVCAHHHLYSSLARGMPYRLDPPRNFVETLRRLWWRLDRALDDEAVWASAVVGGAVAILNGTTTVIDHHASPNAVDGSLDLIAS